jgi:hypothetical protein
MRLDQAAVRDICEQGFAQQLPTDLDRQNLAAEPKATLAAWPDADPCLREHRTSLGGYARVLLSLPHHST